MKLNREHNNFDFLRLFFSVIVAIYHLLILTKSTAIFTYIPTVSAEIAVDSFFTISGFLIFISYEYSKSLKHYFLKRAKRIFPAYMTVIVISSIVLYFISNKENLFNYFNIDYIKYLVSNLLTLNFLHPTLPGVFENNWTSSVNGALWTIKIEIMFYITVPIIVYFIHKLNLSFVLIFTYALSIVYSVTLLNIYNNTHLDIYLTLEKQLPGQLAFFISGAILYYYNAIFIKYRYATLLFATIVIFVHFNIQNIYPIYPLSLAILIIYVATILPYFGNFSKYGDLSFGIYIWHFPIIQTLIALHLFDTFWIGTIISIFLIFSAGIFSWHSIEKKFLKRKV